MPPSTPRWRSPGKLSPRLTPTREGLQTKPSPSSPGVRSNPPSTKGASPVRPASSTESKSARSGLAAFAYQHFSTAAVPPCQTGLARANAEDLTSLRSRRAQGSGLPHGTSRGPDACYQVAERGLALVERGADHHAGNTWRTGERGHVFGTTDAAAGDGGDYLRHGRGPFEGCPCVHSVPCDIGVEYRGDTVAGQFFREIQDRDPARPPPTVRHDDSIAGVNGNEQRIAGLLDCPEPQVPVFDRCGSHHYAPGACLPHGAYVVYGADAPSNLEWDANRPCDTADELELDGPAFLGAVEVDHVDRLSPLSHPLAGALDGIGIILLGPPEVPLREPHALPATQVDSGIDGEAAQTEPAQARKFSYSFKPALLLFSGWNWTATRFSLPAAEQKRAP